MTNMVSCQTARTSGGPTADPAASRWLKQSQLEPAEPPVLTPRKVMGAQSSGKSKLIGLVLQGSFWVQAHRLHCVLMPLLEDRHVSSTRFLFSAQGYFWVEAHKLDYVRDALRGLRIVFQSKTPHQVPLAQMVETISVPKPTQALLGAPPEPLTASLLDPVAACCSLNQCWTCTAMSVCVHFLFPCHNRQVDSLARTRGSVSAERDSWARVRNGLYKDDLCRVTDVDYSSGRATIEVSSHASCLTVSCMQDGLATNPDGCRQFAFEASCTFEAPSPALQLAYIERTFTLTIK